MNKFIIAVVFAMSASVAVAQDATVPAVADPATVVEDTPVMIAPSDALTASFATICASAAVLSEKAQLACLNVALPKVSKDGNTFRNVGIGAEFNTLIRNVAAFN